MQLSADCQSLRRHFARQLEHWRAAARRLADPETLAPPQAWQALEHYLGVSLRQSLSAALDHFHEAARRFEADLRLPASETTAERLHRRLQVLRDAYLRAETTLDFYSDALASRANPKLAPLLLACDHIATRSMAEALKPLGRQVPAALSYLDKGLGASILKAGLRLWDGTVENPVAAIKVVRHSILRPTAILHESGHQVAHSLGWNEELAESFQKQLAAASPTIGEVWMGWASEVAADAFAFAHSGYASVVALHEVLNGADESVFLLPPGDPHPLSYLRVLLGSAMCRQVFGEGPWDDLDAVWIATHRLETAPVTVRSLVKASLPFLPMVAETTLTQPYRAFGGRALVALINPLRVSPAELSKLEREAGEAAFSSQYWIWNEAIRLTALTGYCAGTDVKGPLPAQERQEQIMLKLGGLRYAV